MSMPAPFQFGLSSLLLITTLVAVILSISVMVPGIGICLAIVSVPALVRTYVVVRGQRATRAKWCPIRTRRCFSWRASCTATLIAVATAAAFFVTCLRRSFRWLGMNFGGGMNSLATWFRTYRRSDCQGRVVLCRF